MQKRINVPLPFHLSGQILLFSGSEHGSDKFPQTKKGISLDFLTQIRYIQIAEFQRELDSRMAKYNTTEPFFNTVLFFAIRGSFLYLRMAHTLFTKEMGEDTCPKS